MRNTRIAVVVALAIAIVAGSAGPVHAADSPPTLSVNDRRAVGAPKDKWLSLDEAIRLANGNLRLDSLSPAERKQVRGIPGAYSADRIRVTLPPKATILSPASVPESSGISRILGNDGDTLDGGGATLKGLAPTGIGLSIASSDFTLTNLTVTGYNEGVVIDFGGLRLRNITITKVRLMPALFGPLVVGARSSNGSLRGLTITKSTFVGGAVSDSTATVVLAGIWVRGRLVSNAHLEDVLFEDNEVSGALESFYIYGAVANGGTADHGFARNVRVLNNYFHDGADAAMNIDGGTGIADSVTDSGVDGVLMEGNRVVAKSWGIGVWAGEAFGANVVQRNFVKNVTIRSNSVTSMPGADTWCVILESGRGDIAGVAINNTISNIRIENNKLSKCTLAGVAVHAGVPLAGSVATNNTVSDIAIVGNEVTRSAMGFVIRGALVGPGSAGSGNVTRRVEITGNTLTNNDRGIVLVGGEVQGQAGGVATGNSAREMVMRSNRITGPKPCTATANVGLTATNNAMSARC